MPRSFLAMAILALFVTSAAGAQTLTGDDARKSLQADAFLAYEHALIEGGLKAAIPYMTPEKLADLKGMAEMFGEEGFNEFFAACAVALRARHADGRTMNAESCRFSLDAATSVRRNTDFDLFMRTSTAASLAYCVKARRQSRR